MGTCLFGEGECDVMCCDYPCGERAGCGRWSMVIRSHKIYNRLPPIFQIKYLMFREVM